MYTGKCIAYRTGPLIASWCMRMEGKNSFCKRAAQKSNFKNVPYTVTKRHQHLLCAYLNSSNFFDWNLECGPGEHVLCIDIIINFVLKFV